MGPQMLSIMPKNTFFEHIRGSTSGNVDKYFWRLPYPNISILFCHLHLQGNRYSPVLTKTRSYLWIFCQIWQGEKGQWGHIRVIYDTINNNTIHTQHRQFCIKYTILQFSQKNLNKHNWPPGLKFCNLSPQSNTGTKSWKKISKQILQVFLNSHIVSLH